MQDSEHSTLPRPGLRRSGGPGIWVSLCFHAVLVSWLLSGTAIPALREPDVVAFEIELARPPEPPPSEPQPAPPEPERPRAPLPAPAPRARVSPPAAPVVEPRPAQPEEATPAAATVATEPAPPPPTARQAVSTLDDELRSYGKLVWTQVTRRKPRHVTYPGATLIRFALSPAGSLISAEVVDSSGSPSLDRLALDAVTAAAPFPPPPAGAGEERLRFTIPFHFR